MGLVPGARQAKDTVRYRPHEKCAFCDYFHNSGTCEIVEGNIAADAICDKFEIRSVAGNDGKDASFYLETFEKTREG